MRGGYGSSGHGSLHDRVHGVAAEPPSPARHCFVEGRPGLLVEWRQGVAGWEGRVVDMCWLDGEGWATVERWLPAARIEPGG